MSITQVTVFGGSGFIGRAIVRALAQEGLQVRVAVRRIELAESVKTAGDVGQITVMRTNLRMPQSVAAAIQGSQAVINASGIPFQRGRQRYQTVHVAGARAIAEAARAAGVARLVHISGIGADHRGSKNRFVQSKVGAEDAIVAAFPSATILRLSVVFGPDDAMFNRLARIAALAPFVPVVGSGLAKVQPVFCGDVGHAAAAVLARPETARTVFDLGGPRVYTFSPSSCPCRRSPTTRSSFSPRTMSPGPAPLVSQRWASRRPRLRSSCRPIWTAFASAVATTSTLPPNKIGLSHPHSTPGRGGGCDPTLARLGDGHRSRAGYFNE